jgi:predicted transcriptional regulator
MDSTEIANAPKTNKRYSESQKACIKRYYDKNREKINEKQRERYKKKVEFNKETLNAWKREFEAKFKQKMILDELEAVKNEKIKDE